MYATIGMILKRFFYVKKPDMKYHILYDLYEHARISKTIEIEYRRMVVRGKCSEEREDRDGYQWAQGFFLRCEKHPGIK